jgi:PAS domain S-box-containing protein
MESSIEGLEATLDRSFDRALLFGIIGFIVLVVFTVFYPFSSESAPYWCFILGSLAVAQSTVLIYQYRTMDLRAALRAAEIAENSIRSSRDLFTEVYQRSPVPYLLITETGAIESCNTAAVRLFKSREETLHGRDVFSCLQSAHVDHIEILRERFTRGVALSGEECEVVHDVGTSAWVLLSLFHFVDVSQRRLGLMTLVDITKQREIDTAKTEFVSLASHQLRTPIAGMRWNTELLMYDSAYPLPPEQELKAKRLMRSIDRLTALVDDFLSVSRFELGELTATPTPVSMRILLDEIVSEQQSSMADKKITLEVPPTDQFTEEIVVDGKLLSMIITNFLVNAIKYTPVGGVIKIGAHRINDLLEVTIADNGIGIPPAEQRRLFSKMFRASNAEKLITEGTGLGLYIAKRAAQAMGGSVSFTSGEGVGSAFTVTVPVEAVALHS